MVVFAPIGPGNGPNEKQRRGIPDVVYEQAVSVYDLLNREEGRSDDLFE